jgi:hypothetical protein
LTFRWDEAKFIHRESTISLDGDERVRCLMRIAYDMKGIQVPWVGVEDSARRHLALLQMNHVSAKVLMHEIAQWYGLFVPVDADNWQFVHRTIGDYLSARYWPRRSPKVTHLCSDRVAHTKNSVSRSFGRVGGIGGRDSDIIRAALLARGKTINFIKMRVAVAICLRSARSEPGIRTLHQLPT